ncbi:MAG: hypothetical protein A2912_00795 [Candidatus Buchananbacteria bacterium RIFCSPLOWO2_01_FULL_40_23b]|uniref:HPr kinase/phosphorylase C-terminal domain-containing protein n=2 Tax=Candidatus Buchananiibacteriota TaxID=1817903 RepID=A0A1G1YUG8_9BACT|nr:MAG: hypothetical protein A2912_00795 [Candidatus Buchananbacteria bacterium RIFCSPLOWO2_01_FULL_40_23b]
MKTPFVCNISMGHLSVNIFSRINFFLPLFLGREEYIPFIPGWRCTTNKVKTKYSITYIPSKRSNLVYSKNRQSVKVYGEQEYFNDGQTIAYLVYSLLEVDRQKNNETTAHLAACSKDGKGIMLLGERGAGKTSILLALCRRYGYKIIANDLALLGFDKKRNQIFINDGTKIFGLRHTAAKMHHPDLLRFFSGKIKDSWTTKSFILPKEINVFVENKKMIISKVFFCHLHANKEENFFEGKMSGGWIKVSLYENFSRYIRGSSVIPFLGGIGGNSIGYIPSLDQLKFHQQRVKLINYLVNNLGIIHISGGNLQQMCDFINKETFGKK